MREPDVIRGCLQMLNRRQWCAAGVLADYLDETEHPKAKAVRKLWNKHEARVAAYAAKDWSRSRYWTAWEAIAFAHHMLWCGIRNTFKCKWKVRLLNWYR